MSDKVDKIILAAIDLEQVCPTEWPDIGILSSIANSPSEAAELIRRLRLLAERVREAALLPGEPIFCMRGNDLAALRTINFWIEQALLIGASRATLDEADQKWTDFQQWQKMNPQSVKVPT